MGDYFNFSMDESDFPALGRPSCTSNDDDYDFAMELVPNDEYRQVAEALDDIVDFDAIDAFTTDSPTKICNIKPLSSLLDEQKLDEKTSNNGKLQYISSYFSGVFSSPRSECSVTPIADKTRNDIENGIENGDIEFDVTDVRECIEEQRDLLMETEAIITPKMFKDYMGLLEKRKKWVQSSARRSLIQ